MAAIIIGNIVLIVLIGKLHSFPSVLLIVIRVSGRNQISPLALRQD